MSRQRSWIRLAAGLLVVWGVIHILGGISLLVADTSVGLDTLAPGAIEPAALDPGQGVEGLLRFHSLNIALAGIAVAVLGVWWWRSERRAIGDAALLLAVGFDIGLIAFLVVPGLLPLSEGLIGPVLAGLAAAGWLLAARSGARPSIAG